MRKRLDRRLVGAIATIGVATLAWLGLTMGLIASTFDADQRVQVMGQIGPRLPLIVLTWLLGLFAITMVLRWLFRRYIQAPARLVEQVRVLLAAPQAYPMHHNGTRETQELARAIDALAQQRDQLRGAVAEQVALASQGVQHERNLLATLMEELTQSVVVCNAQGQILLFNHRARMQLRVLSKAPDVAAGVEVLGIGRSVYSVFDVELITHALDSIASRMERGADNPVAQFAVSTQAGQLLRVQVAPVCDSTQGDTVTVTGFVLMLENMTRTSEEERKRAQQLQALVERCRDALSDMQSVLQADHDAEERQTLLRDGLLRGSSALSAVDRFATQQASVRWPLQDMRVSDVAWIAKKRIEQACLRPVTVDVPADIAWVSVDGYSLNLALTYLASRLVDELAVRFFDLRLALDNDKVLLDLVWRGHAVSTETVMGWELDEIQVGTQRVSFSVRDVLSRHHAELSFLRERARHEAFFRFVLPAVHGVDEGEVLPSRQAPAVRPEFYDFDLFKVSDRVTALEDRLLAELSYTVFDTETTGLQPNQGDQIVQIGAARIVNGRLRRNECFEQLVDPGRTIPANVVAIHGISQEMVRGKPRIAQVLPVFQGFVADTVLVAHNAAFDMKFLQLQEKETGIVFSQPVLDTLLLSALVHPNQESHRLEDIALRFNIPVQGRHTALSDALVTAEIFLRLIPLLQAMGIHTLGQARAASQSTYYARLKY